MAKEYLAWDQNLEGTEDRMRDGPYSRKRTLSSAKRPSRFSVSFLLIHRATHMNEQNPSSIKLLKKLAIMGLTVMLDYVFQHL